MKQIFKYLAWLVLAVVVLLVVVAVACFKPLDTTPYRETSFYKRELDAIEQTVPYASNDTGVINVGWASVNLLPPFGTPIAIDAKRGGKYFEGVHDSIYVRAFVFKQGNKKIGYVSADLLIIPPLVTKMFDSLLVKEGFDTRNIYFTATHTHTSIGAWHNSYVGEIFAGKYDSRIPAFIAQKISGAILAAEKNCTPAKIGYGEFATQHLVYNRLVHDSGRVDSMLRIVKIEKDNGQRAAMVVFSAHCTVFHENLMSLSGDWAGIMMTDLNKMGKINFSCYSAGEVGSHGPFEFVKNQEAEALYMAYGVGNLVLDSFDSIPTAYCRSMNMLHVPLYLREPDLRVTPHIAIRPWLFKKLFGDEHVYINTFRIGDIEFEGSPCDFSGELIGPIDSVAKSKKLHLIVTSFNGGYIGYVTDSRWYGLNTYETRTMGWFGPGNGDYLSEVMMRLM
ncbi:MAG TPA: neutral/alkaline non-lysosomal ceramidase N-terminal domain-containing protein [Chitinophagales bacterium]|nr:neutral/alkaline non-lysosomal ceramidase N-terminal domain-containing protein [Chitinophagales bacterium]